MTVPGFIFLLIAAVAGITVGAHFAESWAAPGLERTFAVALITAAIMFPAAKLAEWFGWIRGGLNMGGAGEGDRRRDEAARAEAVRDGAVRGEAAGGSGNDGHGDGGRQR
jgi:hypothetical protein